MEPLGPGSAVLEIATAQGLARVHLPASESTRGALVLGHGAGGGVAAPDLAAASAGALAAGLGVGLVEQPYRVAGKKAPPRAPRLDEAWVEIVAALRDGPLATGPLVTGGRSAGARVACRTAGTTGAAAVLCLAFPLVPPRGARETRLPELEGAGVPVLVVQGDRDRFGRPPAGPAREVVTVAGDHALRKDPAAVRAAVEGWLLRVLRLEPMRRSARAGEPGAPSA